MSSSCMAVVLQPKDAEVQKHTVHIAVIHLPFVYQMSLSYQPHRLEANALFQALAQVLRAPSSCSVVLGPPKDAAPDSTAIAGVDYTCKRQQIS